MCKHFSFKSGVISLSTQVTIEPVSIGVEMQLNNDGDTPSRTIHVFHALTCHMANGRCLKLWPPCQGFKHDKSKCKEINICVILAFSQWFH